MFGWKSRNRSKARPGTSSRRGSGLALESLENRLALASIAGSVYHDVDGNNEFSGSDRGIAGIAVTLKGHTNGFSWPIYRTTQTDSNGNYEFKDLKKGNYTVRAGQPDGLLDGNECAGTGGGRVYNDAISDIEIDSNRDAFTGYLFGEFSAASLRGRTYLDLDRDGNFDSGDRPLSEVDVQLSGTDDRGQVVSQRVRSDRQGSYAFTNLRPGTYELRGTTPRGYTDGRDTLGRFDDNPHPVPDNGQLFNDRFSSIVLTPGRQGRNYDFGEFDETVVEGTLATKFESTIELHGGSSDDLFEFVGGTKEHTVLLNGAPLMVNASVNTRIIFYGHGGSNQAQLTGGAGVDQVETRETSVKLTGVTYQVLVYSTRSVSTQSGGGNDRAMLYDTAGDEHFAADPSGASLSGLGFAHSVYDFHRVYAYATAGSDEASCTGSDGDDRWTATPTDSRMEGDGFYNFVRGFDVVHAEARGGDDDRAYLYDSSGDDTYVATANESRLYGLGFDNFAHGFDRVYAYASGGTDLAVFQDTLGKDTFRVDNDGARMYGAGYYNRAIGFENHEVTFTSNDPNTDRVDFFDSAGNDSITAEGDQFTAVRDGARYQVRGADLVVAQASVGSDTSHVNSPLFALQLLGSWLPV